jgi:uncharacterized DUF497 family protein
MLLIKELVWDDQNEAHIARHGVAVDEVEDVCSARSLGVRIRRGRYRIIGQTSAGRYLTVILDSQRGEEFYVVTAREATEPERGRFRSWRGR